MSIHFKYTLSVLILFVCSVCFSQITSTEQNNLKFLGDFYAYYPTLYDNVTLCPVSNPDYADTVVCNNFPSGDGSYVYQIAFTQKNATIDPEIKPDFSILPLDFPNINSFIFFKPNIYNTSIHPMTLFGNISSASWFRVMSYVNTTSFVEPYYYNFSSYYYPVLSQVNIGDMPNATLEMNAPAATMSISNITDGVIIVTSTVMFRARLFTFFVVDWSTKDFVLAGATIYPYVQKKKKEKVNVVVVLQRSNKLPFYICFKSVCPDLSDYPNFYLSATNDTIPKYLYCNRKINLTYLPLGYAAFTNQTETGMCGATLDKTSYFVQNGVITITGENLLYISKLFNRLNGQLVQIDHSDGLVEINKSTTYQYTIQSSAKQGTEIIIFSKFHGIQFTIDWSKEYYIKNVTFRLLYDEVHWMINGIFNTSGLVVDIGNYSCNIVESSEEYIYCIVKEDILTGSYNISVKSDFSDSFYIKEYIKITFITQFLQIVSGTSINMFDGNFTNLVKPNVYFNGTKVQVVTSNTTNIISQIYPVLPEGWYNLTVESQPFVSTNFSEFKWTYPTVTTANNSGLTLTINGNFGSNLRFIQIKIGGDVSTTTSTQTTSSTPTTSTPTTSQTTSSTTDVISSSGTNFAGTTPTSKPGSNVLIAITPKKPPQNPAGYTTKKNPNGWCF
ncbi:hypothetical protein PPL_01466 [Heterostelium album PN500]|uniref:Uncharacterized protein n=1 Tax=Heterostelium pallidum (strain ATCC 26659 / Pp 5 / PN500) TaxID=670386 RepID=D3AZC6_HETP5|nr:hypothetical protein PPL_01466 [Heterostelium album PN500]EFA85509.1 hypothetical protein PPL_01466 [Heterostelium album PN500]|eukprot:XP_020437617.1 hypothetical protein PPL_01466 [Heterostelium album PN500]